MTNDPFKYEQELVPCPWCGKKPRGVAFREKRKYVYRIGCPYDSCKMVVRTKWCDTPKEAREIWNSIKIELSANESAHVER